MKKNNMLKTLLERINNNEKVTIIIKGQQRVGMSSSAILFAEEINRGINEN